MPEGFTKKLLADLINKCPPLVATSAREHLGYSLEGGCTFNQLADFEVFKREISCFIASGKVAHALQEAKEGRDCQEAEAIALVPQVRLMLCADGALGKRPA